MKKALSVLLSLFCLFTLVSCKGAENKPPKAPENAEITLLYSGTDSFNPYAAKSVHNRRLSTLIFDSLYKFDNKYKPVPQIAVSNEYEGTVYTVHIGAVTFSDGSPLTSADVLYSYNFAKSSSTFGLADSLAEVGSVETPDPQTIVFTLNRVDPYFLNLLTFPILKTDSAGLYDSDGVEIPPIGSGRYIPDIKNSCLTRNENYIGIKSLISKINLIASPDAEASSHYVESGVVDIYYTDSSSNIVRMDGKRCDVDINHLVYIGINSSYGALSSKEMRYAISSALSRSEIADKAYFGAATAAKGFFNPVLPDVKATSSLSEKPNEDVSIENLKNIGYTIKGEDGIYKSEQGNRASFTLLVNEDNSSRMTAAHVITLNAKAAGIEITVDAVPYDTYINRLQSGAFQLYLGEVKIAPNMDIRGLACPGGRAAFGVSESNPDTAMTVSGSVSAYDSGQITLSALSGVLLTEMPEIPILYRKGSLFYSDTIKGGVEGLSCDIYYSMANYDF
ncbi:MAG: ABC transporter substrate-binding protein [Clostridia bacterium]|nr:ABC transporter substrate-binding protein [Clostridia bacterium]